MRLSQLKRQQQAIITAISMHAAAPVTATSTQDSADQPDYQSGQADAIGQRLQTLGFIPGERVIILAQGLFGRDPLLVQIGFTRFALRRSEADRIEVELKA